ncbi:MAG: hypothetical protein J6R01_04965 [Alistipes sp.]|nr:hypothetical protein [Alistipes sp.]
MKRSSYIVLLIAATMSVACGGVDSFGGRNSQNRVVASVDDKELLLKDILADMPEGLVGADSATFSKMYIDNWILNNLKLTRAEEVLTSQGDINRLVEGYRQSLIMRQLDQYYVDKDLDTEITEQQIKAHYRQHSQQFVLNHDKVRGVVVRIPKEFRNTSTLREALKNASKDGVQEVKALVEKHDLQISDLTTEWVTFSDFLSYLPTVRTRNYDNLLNKGKVQSMQADDIIFYFTITEVINKGSIAPIECVEEDIRRMIYAERRNEIVKKYEEELRYEAMQNDRIEIDDAQMMDAMNTRPIINDSGVKVDEAKDVAKNEDETL